MTENKIFWDSMYEAGEQLNKYPHVFVISSLMREFRERVGIRVLEVGCGAANNLLALAQEGFDVYGIDFSEAVVQVARERFVSNGVNSHIQVGDFLNLPFADQYFDVVIDRAATCCVTRDEGTLAYSEISRVLKAEGIIVGQFYRSPALDGGDCTAIEDELRERGGPLRYTDLDEIHELANRASCKPESITETRRNDHISGRDLIGLWEVVFRKEG